jgi:hypothetical protein
MRKPRPGAEKPHQGKTKKMELNMGQLKRQTLGEASGAIGHLVFRIKGEKNIIAKRPEKKVNPQPPSDKAAAVRAKFTLAGHVAGGIYKAGTLKDLWPKPGTNKGTKYTEMFKKNYLTIGTIDNLGTAQVVPDHGIIVKNAAIALTQKGMTITADQLGADSGIDPNVEKFLLGVGVVIMRTPTNSADPAYKILTVRTGAQSLDNDAPINMSFEFGGLDIAQYEAYTDKKVFLTFITQTAAGAAVHYTEQFNN